MTGEQDIFNINYRNTKPEKGKVLIAEPFLHGRYFGRSVILLTEKDDNGTVGFILNKPLTYGLKDFFPEFKDVDYNVFLGGPMQTGTLYYVHTLGELIPNSEKINDELYWGGDFEALSEMIMHNKLPKDRIRFFLGYSGWSKGQLEDELKEKSWVVSSVDNAHIMNEDNSSMWEDFLQDMGGKFRLWANFPENPNMN